MKWTTEYPSEEGFYWRVSPDMATDNPEVVYVEIVEAKKRVSILFVGDEVPWVDDGKAAHLKRYGVEAEGLWYGPLVAPEGWEDEKTR